MKQNKICVIGLGYVGLTLSLTFTNNNTKIIGIEKNINNLNLLKSGKPHFYEKGLEQSLFRAIKNKKLILSDKIDVAKNCNVFIITVGTPLNINNRPNFEILKKCINEIISLRPNKPLIILRSTVAVGTARGRVLQDFKKNNINIDIAMCPERTMEGVAMKEITRLPQIIGGNTMHSVKRAIDVFKLINKNLITVSSLETAELIKLVDNSSRDLYFSTSNQLALLCETLNLDVYEVITTANNSYSRTNLALPGLVGGPCLEKDPIILYESIKSKKYKPKLFFESRVVNKKITNVVKEWLNSFKTENRNKSIAILGLAFKGNPETSDVRGSLAIDILKILEKFKFNNIYLFDPLDKTYNSPEINQHFKKYKIIKNFNELIKKSNYAIITTNHKYFQNTKRMSNLWKHNSNLKVFDFWNNLKNVNIDGKKKYRAFGVNIIKK